MSITVYWTCFDEEWLRAKPPIPIYNNFVKMGGVRESALNFCGATKKYISQLYGISSLYDYTFTINNGVVNSTNYDQNFFDTHVNIRSEDHKLFSFLQRMIFFTEEKSLNMSAGISPFLENNNISKECITIPGTFDIGNWFRAVDFAFYLKDNINSFKIEEGDVYQYISFNTDEKIVFKQFIPTEKIVKFASYSTGSARSRRNKNRPLEKYYEIFKHKKHILNEIKNNLI
jgi:hypothetical protein